MQLKYRAYPFKRLAQVKSSALHFCACPTPTPPLFSPDLRRVTHARPLNPAALAVVPFGIVRVRVRVLNEIFSGGTVAEAVALWKSVEWSRSRTKERGAPYIEATPKHQSISIRAQFRNRKRLARRSLGLYIHIGDRHLTRPQQGSENSPIRNLPNLSLITYQLSNNRVIDY